MSSEANYHKCCCLHITTCAKIFIVIEFIFAALSIVTFGSKYLPFALFSAISSAFVLIGLQKKTPSYLVPSLILLGLYIIRNFYISYQLLIILKPDLEYIETNETQNNDEKIYFIVTFVFIVGVLLIYNIFAIFEFIVIYRTRKYLIAISESNENNYQKGRPPPAYSMNV